MRKKIYTRNVGVLLSEETYQALISITDKLEISVSEFIRKLIEEKMDHLISNKNNLEEEN
jgi:predicted CopG family antitoxin